MAPLLPEVDVIIVGRGGGSMEDLWCFNDEELARAIADCPVPVISAVGHETDFTICDFAADVRAATPSNAAELAVPDRSAMTESLQLLRRQLERVVGQSLRERGMQVSNLRTRLQSTSPEQRLQQVQLRRDALQSRLDQVILRSLSAYRPRLDMASIRLDQCMDRRMEQSRHQLARLDVRLRAADPRAPLQKGYALVTGPEGVVTCAKDAPEHMTLHFGDGTLAVRREEDELHAQ